MIFPICSALRMTAVAALETDHETLCCVQRPDLTPAPQSGYHSGGNPATAVRRKAIAVKSGQATSGGSQSTVSQKSAMKGAGSTEAPDADSHPPSKRSRLSNLSTVPAKASGVVTSMPSQPTRGSSSSGTSKAGGKGVAEVGAAKAVTSQKAASSGSEPSKVAILNPPAPPPGSPTASSTLQEVVPPPPPAIPLPPQLQSPSSLRPQPAASYGKQVVPAIQAPAQPAKPVSQQLPAQQLRQQAPRQPLLPAGVKPLGPLPVTHAPQRLHVTHMEQQDPPQVQLPASLAAGNHAVQPLQAVPASSSLGHGMQQQSGGTQQQHHRQPQEGLAGQQQTGLMMQQHGQAQSGMHQGAAEHLQAEQRQLQHERALQGQLLPAQLLMGQQQAGHFHAGQPHPWQQQPLFQGGPTQQMGLMRPGQQGGGFQAGAQQGHQWQQGNSHPAFLAGFMPGQRGPSPGPGSGPHMQGHHHGMQQANEAQQMMQAQGLHNSMHVQAQHTQQRPMMSQISRAMAPSSFAQAHFGAFPQQPQQYHQELQLPPPVTLSQPLFKHGGVQIGSLQDSGENAQQLPAGMQPPWQRPTFPS